MKKIYLLPIVLLFCNLALSQVGIATPAPNAQLDVRSSSQTTPANTDGLLIPKMDLFPATNPTVAQQGMLVYLTTTTTFLATTRPPGFYYWNNPTADWIWLNAGANGDHDWYEVGTTTAPNAISDDMFHMGNAAIGKNTAAFPLEVAGTDVNNSVNTTLANATTDGTPNSNIRNSYSGTSTDQVRMVYNEYTGTTSGFAIGVSNYLSGTASPLVGTMNTLTGGATGAHIAAFNQVGSSNVNNIGVRNFIQNSTASGNHTGVANEIYNNSGNGTTDGIFNQLGTSGTGNLTGTNTLIFGAGTGTQTGSYTNISNTGNNIHYGTRNILSGTGTSQKYGIRNELSGAGNQFGTYNLMQGAGAGLQTGSYNEVTSSGNFAHYGAVSTLSGAGTGIKTGMYSYINPAAGGPHYGIYSETLKPGATNFAGYFLGNVGIGTTGANMYTMPASRGTNGQIMQTDGVGNVTWQNASGLCWTTTGNGGTNGGTTVAAGTNFIGTTDNQNIDFRTNNTYRGRFSSLGEFFVGTLNTVLTGDLMNAVGNATFPWATNGYSAFNGAGTYGQVTGGTTIFAGVQGEYNGTNAQGAGVRGSSVNTTAGTGFGTAHSGVNGVATTSGTYKYGVYGSGGTSARTGGVFGYNYGLSMGALGYYAANAIDYSVYGFGLAYTTGLGTGRMVQNPMQKNTNIGLGIYGGVMGGWVRGMKYGFHTKGETYSLYVDGNGYTNKPLAYLIDTDGAKTASYMSVSMRPEVTVNGKTNLENGKVFVPFDSNFSQVIADIDQVIITASPQGKSNGVYIDQISKEGFWIYENNDGVSNTRISWIAISKIKGEENPIVPADLLANDFDKKMDGVMFNDNNKADPKQSLWWDGNGIRWDSPTNEKVDTQTAKLARPNDTKNSK